MEIVHDLTENKFKFTLDNLEAFVHYTQKGNTLTLDHTYVPDEFRGRGYASKLVKTCLEYAKKREFKIIAQCPYIKSYIEKHEEYENLINNFQKSRK